MSKTEKKASNAQLSLMKSKKESSSLQNQIQKSRTRELVIAFCGPLGSGVSTVADKLYDILNNSSYSVTIIKISKIIEQNDSEIQNGEKYKNPADRIKKLQEAGNKLRNDYDNNILAQLAIREIHLNRATSIKSSVDDNKKLDTSSYQKRIAYIIEGLKHPKEVQLLRAVYGNMFYLVGVLCAQKIRETRLTKEKKVPVDKVNYLMEKDKAENQSHGQQLIKTLQHADFFVSPDYS